MPMPRTYKRLPRYRLPLHNFSHGEYRCIYLYLPIYLASAQYFRTTSIESLTCVFFAYIFFISNTQRMQCLSYMFLLIFFLFFLNLIPVYQLSLPIYMTALYKRIFLNFF